MLRKLCAQTHIRVPIKCLLLLSSCHQNWYVPINLVIFLNLKLHVCLFSCFTVTTCKQKDRQITKLTGTLLQLLIFNMPKMCYKYIKNYTLKTLPLCDNELPSTNSELEKEHPPRYVIHWKS